MPTLHWIGKNKVINHHMDVPFKVLEHSYGFDNGERKDSETGSGNKIIHGDNLEALKALLPQYEGKIKCIYIDPPYNTGNENWVYNDNVNDPKILKWLGQVVGKESEDLTRHDKWLCMMYPRLKLLHKLLSNDGVIFISIDDNEAFYLKLVCDEIFGKVNFIAPLIWQSRQSVDARNKTGISNDHEYIYVYKKEDITVFKGVEKDLTKFSNPDNDNRGAWRSADLTGIATKLQRPNLHYDLIDPKTGAIYSCPDKGWRYDQASMAKRIQEGRIIFPKNQKGRPRNKIFMNEMESSNKAFSSVITEMNTGDGSKELKQIFGANEFTFPKPSCLVSFLIDQITKTDSIILDSFAGSGTTAHAVLNLNKQDGGNRKFILIEMEDYAENITAERVKRVINGYGEGNKAVEGTGGSFDFYALGEPLFDTSGNLNEAVGIDKIRGYIWYAETQLGHDTLLDAGHHDNSAYLGQHNETAYYFHYQPEGVTTLNHDFLATIKTKAGQYVIYADNCLLTKDFMTKHNIIFKKIPRDITRF